VRRQQRTAKIDVLETGCLATTEDVSEDLSFLMIAI
jgi:hypothetical protein